MEAKQEQPMVLADEGGAAKGPFTRIICMPVDESVESLKTFKWAMETVLVPGSDQVFFLHCRPWHPDVDAQMVMALADMDSPYLVQVEESEDIREGVRMASHAILMEYLKLAAERGIDGKACSLCGVAQDEIFQKIESIKPDLVIVGNRGRGAVTSFLLGSLSEYLALHSTVPVLIGKLA
ncbi:hypothetical protein HDV03_004779 [Kappamyces sp. JEL0829]|nr:hypothetical protein HDV03_004779 [Kappamyces sp. JEL0829]KAJ3360186.1 hypothetical protein HDU91_004689 [Kappamyces sp. JEL0680]